MRHELVFKDVYNLHKLPFFDLNEEEELILSQDFLRKFLIDEIVDFHTHLGWHYLLSRPIDLHKESKVKHYFPYRGEEIYLGQYSALEFNEKIKSKSKWQTVLSLITNRGYSGTHTIPNLLEEMSRFRIKTAIVNCVDFPKFMISNQSERVLAETKKQRKEGSLIVFASLHPLMKKKEEKIRKHIENGALGIKLHPPMQLSKPNSEGYMEIYELCDHYRLPVLFHTGFSPLTPRWTKKFTKPNDFKEPVRKFPDVTFIFGHAGGENTSREMAQIANEHENVYMEIDGQPPLRLHEIIDIMGSDRILYGSDWPYYPMAMQLAKVLVATRKKPFLRKKILSGNANLLLEDIRTKLRK